MKWRFEDEGQASYKLDVEIADAALVVADVRDRTNELFPSEIGEMAQMAPKRKAAFSSGRWCAAGAQEIVTGTAQAVTRQGRVPVWPNGLHGSITHSDRIAASVVSRDTNIGIDIETLERLHKDLYWTLFTQREITCLPHLGKHAETVMFSAKEAAYKAIYPIGKEFIDFHDVEIDLDERSKTFSVMYIGTYEPNKALEQGFGQWTLANDHVFTMFVIP